MGITYINYVEIRRRFTLQTLIVLNIIISRGLLKTDRGQKIIKKYKFLIYPAFKITTFYNVLIPYIF